MSYCNISTFLYLLIMLRSYINNELLGPAFFSSSKESPHKMEEHLGDLAGDLASSFIRIVADYDQRVD